MESVRHHRLKLLGAAWLRQHGFRSVALEVGCPLARARVDVAAWSDRHMPDREPMTVILECKQSRPDFVRDRRHVGRLQRMRERLVEERELHERRRLPKREPHLRRQGSALFPELGEWAWEESEDASYRRCLRRLRRLDAQIHGETKFFLFERYRLADRMYVVAPEGLIRPRDLPPGWGLLEAGRHDLDAADAKHAPRSGRGRGATGRGRPLPFGAGPVGVERVGDDLFGDAPLTVRVAAPSIRRATRRFRQRLLVNISVAASRDALRPHGVDPSADARQNADPGRPRGPGRSVGPAEPWSPPVDPWRPSVAAPRTTVHRRAASTPAAESGGMPSLWASRPETATPDGERPGSRPSSTSGPGPGTCPDASSSSSTGAGAGAGVSAGPGAGSASDPAAPTGRRRDPHADRDPPIAASRRGSPSEDAT